MQLQRLDMQVGAVEDADDLGQLGLAAGQLDGDAPASVAARLAEPRQQLGEPARPRRARRV